MNTDRIAKLKQIVGDQPIKVLSDLLNRSEGCPPGIRADRYRADHPELLDVLDRLESAQLFLRRQHDNPSNYQITVYALPILDAEQAKKYLQIMDTIYINFQNFYRERLSDPIPVTELLDKVKTEHPYEEKEIKDALFYMAEGIPIWSGKSLGFPYGDNGTLCVSEHVLRQPTLFNAIEQFYDWHILNPRNIVTTGHNTSDQNNRESAAFFRRDEVNRPDWYEKLDDQKKALISEIDTALQNNLASLPTMGLRTLLESIVLDHIEDQGVFKKNLIKFVEQGYMTSKQADLVSDVVDAGNAAVHRAYFPNPSDLLVCVEVVKHLAHGVYILGPLVHAMAENTPRRPDKQS